MRQGMDEQGGAEGVGERDAGGVGEGEVGGHAEGGEEDAGGAQVVEGNAGGVQGVEEGNAEGAHGSKGAEEKIVGLLTALQWLCVVRLVEYDHSWSQYAALAHGVQCLGEMLAECRRCGAQKFIHITVQSLRACAIDDNIRNGKYLKGINITQSTINVCKY